MAQWIGQFSGRTHESRIADVEATLRRAIESLAAAGADSSAHERKNVLNLAEKLLAARTRQHKARLSQKRERATAESPAENALALVRLEQSVAEMKVAGISAILKEFGVRDVDSVLGSRSDKSLERTRGR